MTVGEENGVRGENREGGRGERGERGEGKQGSGHKWQAASTCLLGKLDVAEVVRHILLEGAVGALNVHKNLQRAALGCPTPNAAFQSATVHLKPQHRFI